MTRSAEEQDFDDFYRATASRVVHLVYATTGDLTLAQDCTQEAYAKAWADWRRVRSHEEPLSWVRTVARRLAISEWRRGQARQRAYTKVGEDGPTAGPTEDRVAILEALRQLSPTLRETVTLHYIGDLSIDQIAAETDTPAGTIKARLHRGRTQLAELLRTTDTTRGATSLDAERRSRHG
jgi:RNA polymerase sigma-70 factor (sigma-E family)